MKIIVKSITGLSYDVEVDPRATIEDLKQKFEEQHGFAAADLNLILNNQIQDDSKNLSEINFGKNTYFIFSTKIKPFSLNNQAQQSQTFNPPTNDIYSDLEEQLIQPLLFECNANNHQILQQSDVASIGQGQIERDIMPPPKEKCKSNTLHLLKKGKQGNSKKNLKEGGKRKYLTEGGKSVLVGMGYDGDIAEAALVITEGNINAAIEFLENQNNDTQQLIGKDNAIKRKREEQEQDQNQDYEIGNCIIDDYDGDTNDTDLIQSDQNSDDEMLEDIRRMNLGLKIGYDLNEKQFDRRNIEQSNNSFNNNNNNNINNLNNNNINNINNRKRARLDQDECENEDETSPNNNHINIDSFENQDQIDANTQDSKQGEIKQANESTPSQLTHQYSLRSQSSSQISNKSQFGQINQTSTTKQQEQLNKNRKKRNINHSMNDKQSRNQQYITKSKVNQLISMGIDSDIAHAALIKAKGKLNEAVSYLFDEDNEDDDVQEVDISEYHNRMIKDDQTNNQGEANGYLDSESIQNNQIQRQQQISVGSQMEKEYEQEFNYKEKEQEQEIKEIEEMEDLIIFNISNPNQYGESFNLFKISEQQSQKKIILNNSLLRSETQQGKIIGQNLRLSFNEAKCIILQMDNQNELKGNIQLIGGIAEVIFINERGIILDNFQSQGIKILYFLVAQRFDDQHQQFELTIGNKIEMKNTVSFDDAMEVNVIAHNIYVGGQVSAQDGVLNIKTGNSKAMKQYNGMYKVISDGNQNERNSIVIQHMTNIKAKRVYLQTTEKKTSIEINGNMNSTNGNLAYESANDIIIGGKVILSSEGKVVVLKPTRNIFVGQSTIQGNLNVKIDANGETRITGGSSIKSGGNVIIKTNYFQLNSMKTMNDEELSQITDPNIKLQHLQQSSYDAQSSVILAGGHITIITPEKGKGTTGFIDLMNHQLISNRVIFLWGKTLRNFCAFERQEGQILERFPGVAVISGSNVKLNFKDTISNQGIKSHIEARNNITIQTGMLDNKSQILSEGIADINSNQIYNQNSAIIQSNKEMTINSKSKVMNMNHSIINTKSGNLRIKSKETINHGVSTIRSGNDLFINGQKLDNIGVDIQPNNAIVRFDKSGQRPGIWDTVSEGQEHVDVLMTTDPSQILSNNKITLEVTNIQNRSSRIVSGQNLLINGGIINNERNWFGREVKYITHERWERYRFLISNEQKDEKIEFKNPEIFYSKTPSVIMGRNIEIYSSEVVNQDPLRQHSEQDALNTMSKIEAEDSLFMRVNKIYNRGHFISTNGFDDIIATTFIENEGGVIVSKKGGQIKALDRITNKALVNNYTADVGRRGDAPNYNTRVTFNICNEPAVIGTSSSNNAITDGSNSANQQTDLKVIAPLVENIGSYIVNGTGTLQVIANVLNSSNYEIEIAVDQQSGISNVISQTKSLNSGIMAQNVDIQAKIADFTGTNIKAIRRLNIKSDTFNFKPGQESITQLKVEQNETLLSKEQYSHLQQTRQNIMTSIQAPIINIETEQDQNYIGNIIGKEIQLTSHNGDVNIEGASDEYKSIERREKKEFGGFTGGIDGSGAYLGIVMNKERESHDISQSSIQNSSIQAQHLTINANNITARATNANVQLADINARNNLAIESMEGVTEQNDNNNQMQIKATIGIQNSYLETANSAIAAGQVLEQLNKATSQLNKIQELYDEGKASEESLKQAQINVAKLSTYQTLAIAQLSKAGATAAGTSITAGFHPSFNVDVSGSEQNAMNKTVSHSTSNWNVGRLNANVGGDVNIKGGNIQIREEGNINVKGNMNIESEQNTSDSSSSSQNIGISLDELSGQYGNSQLQTRQSETLISGITSQQKLNINVDGQLNQKASIINSENGQLKLKVGSHQYQDLESGYHEKENGFNISADGEIQDGEGSTTIGIRNKEKQKKIVTHATIGPGQLIIGNDGQGQSNINRDVSKIIVEQEEQILSDIDATLTIDNKIFTEKGRNEMLQNINTESIINKIKEIGIDQVQQRTGVNIQKLLDGNVVGFAKDLAKEQIYKKIGINVDKLIDNDIPGFIKDQIQQQMGIDIQKLMDGDAQGFAKDFSKDYILKKTGVDVNKLIDGNITGFALDRMKEQIYNQAGIDIQKLIDKDLSGFISDQFQHHLGIDIQKLIEGDTTGFVKDFAKDQIQKRIDMDVGKLINGDLIGFIDDQLSKLEIDAQLQQDIDVSSLNNDQLLGWLAFNPQAAMRLDVQDLASKQMTQQQQLFENIQNNSINTFGDINEMNKVSNEISSQYWDQNMEQMGLIIEEEVDEGESHQDISQQQPMISEPDN